MGALMILGVLGYTVTAASAFPVERFTGLGQLLQRAQTLSLFSPFLLVVTPLWRRFRHNVVLGPVTVEMAAPFFRVLNGALRVGGALPR